MRVARTHTQTLYRRQVAASKDSWLTLN